MTANNQPKAVMQEVKNSTEPGAPSGTASEVVPQARRRQCFNADKRRILVAVDRCNKPGETGAIMCSEGVYSSWLTTWR
jgi:hypothetical protein